jgi:Putative peptidoglycan binding domain
MPLQAPRFAGDPTLEGCLAGNHRMTVGEQGPAVRKVQEALIDLGFSIPDGATGGFFNQTGTAVTAFKTSRGIFPNDPVVGVNTMAALDAECFDKPPPPFTERDEWLSWRDRAAAPLISSFNFTRADELSRRSAGTSYTFDSMSSWLPVWLRNAMAQSLSALLEPTGSPSGPGTGPASWGAGPFDLYHCHLGLLKQSGIIPAFDGLLLHNHIQALRQRSATAPGAAFFNIQWALAHRANLLSSGVLQEAGALADEAKASASFANPLVLIWHSFERPRWRPATMPSSSPLRHWQTTLDPAPALTVLPFPFFTPSEFSSVVHELFEIQFLVSKSAVITAAPGSEHEVYSLAGLAPDDVAAVTD